MKVWWIAVVVAMTLAAVSGSHSSAADPTAATAETLRTLEAEFMKAALARGSQGYMSYYADDAVELPNGAAAIRGKENIAKTMGFLDSKDNQLTWTPVYADISASGDQATPTELSSSGPKTKMGRPPSDTGNTLASGRNRRWQLESRARYGNDSPDPASNGGRSEVGPSGAQAPEPKAQARSAQHFTSESAGIASAWLRVTTADKATRPPVPRLAPPKVFSSRQWCWRLHRGFPAVRWSDPHLAALAMESHTAEVGFVAISCTGVAPANSGLAQPVHPHP
jgi:ketosteroid isomerase-like protein